ncbi:MAG: RimK family alpha-L-glutamate ligase [Acidobacteriota bacterium]
MTRIALLNSGGGWHLKRLCQAFTDRGALAETLPIPRLVGATGTQAPLSSIGRALTEYDAVVVRVIPLGSLEQIVFRMDALHRLERLGVPIFNPPRAIERTVDKFWASSLLEDAGIPTPRTVTAESFQDALEAFRRLGGDVVVKPLFGSGGRGIFRLTDEEMAYRAFRTMEMHRWVYYLQEFIGRGARDIRAFVVGGRVVAACRRAGIDWRRNVSRGAETWPHRLSDAQEELALGACRALEVEYAGVDLLEDSEGRMWVLEANSIPGWSGLQETTSVDIAGEIAGHVLHRARGSRPAAATG